MDAETANAFIAISDTHLGLRAGRRLHFFKNTVTNRPDHVDQFLKWLIELSKDGFEYVDIGDRPGELNKKKLLAPERLVLNGDIFEQLDASDRSVEFASYSVIQTLAKIKCEILYLVGNHDITNQQLAQQKLKEGEVQRGLYPWGLSILRIFRDTYPEKKNGSVVTLGVGNDHYLFLHGHQFEVVRGFNPWVILSALRDGAEAFRLYSWAIVWSWIFSIGLIFLLQSFVPLVILYLAAIILGFFALPRLIVSIARPIWNNTLGRLHNLRYDPDRVKNRFHRWWKRFSNKEKVGKIHVVYGHTHSMDIPTNNGEFVLINHPAWVKDLRKKYNTVIQAVFLYADAEGFEFFGWDWNPQCPRPFHIPKYVIENFERTDAIDAQIGAWLDKLHWPAELIEEWKQPGTNKR